MTRQIGPKEAEMRRQREANYEQSQRQARDTKLMLDQMKKLRGDVAAVPARRSKKKRT
jgi:hypothetical protein